MLYIYGMEETKQDERPLEQYVYPGQPAIKEPASRVKALQAAMTKIRPAITPFEVSTLQSDSLYTNIEVTYRQVDKALFEVVKIEEK